jgi:hypothetical protein
MKDSTRVFRHVRLVLAAVLSLAGAATAYATDSYNTSTHVLTIPKVAIGAATYSNMMVNVGTIVSPPSGTSPNSSEDSYDPASGQLTVAAVKVGSNTFFNAVVNVTGMVSVGSVTGADTYDGTHLTVASVQLANAAYTNVVLAVGFSNIVQLAGGMPTAGQDQYNAALSRLFIPAVQVGSTVHTNVTLFVTAANIVHVGGGGAIPISQVSGDLHSYYVAGTYRTNDATINDANTTDADILENISVGACTTGGTPCPFSASTISLSSNGAATGGNISNGADGGTFASPNSGALAAFNIPTVISLAKANGSTWQGAISLSDVGAEMVAMETDANAVPGAMVGLVPAQGVSNASLAGPYTFVGIATNTTTGITGDQGILESLQFDGHGGFTATETINEWNQFVQMGFIRVTAGGSSGSYAVAANGTMSLTFTTGFDAGATFTGAVNGDMAMLTNLNASHGPRGLLVGIAQPTTSAGNQSCTGNPLFGPVFNSGVFTSLGMSYNSSLVRQLTFNNGSAPYTLTLNGATLNSAGVLSTDPGGDTVTYTIDENCFLTVPHQTVGQDVFEYELGAVSQNGSVFVLSDFDTMGGGPQVSVAVRISNVYQLP